MGPGEQKVWNRVGNFCIQSRIGLQNATEHVLVQGTGIKVPAAHPYPKISRLPQDAVNPVVLAMYITFDAAAADDDDDVAAAAAATDDDHDGDGDGDDNVDDGEKVHSPMSIIIIDLIKLITDDRTMYMS